MNLTQKTYFFLFLLTSTWASAQYTEVINSNRPGASSSAYAVGKNVLQLETGFFTEKQEHTGLLTESTLYGGDFALRWGILFEQLELVWEGTYLSEEITYKHTFPEINASRSNFTKNTLGLKYLLFDPKGSAESRKPNLYSWKANNRFQWNNLIPAVSLYAGAHFTLENNPFYPNDPVVSPKAGIATQSHLTPNWVIVTNISYDKITSDDPILSYIITTTFALPNPKWSIFGEHQGIKSDAYADIIFRGGAAHLFSKNFQVDASIGASVKDTPSRLFGGVGLSYRLDFHKDELKQFNDGTNSNAPNKRKQKKK